MLRKFIVTMYMKSGFNNCKIQPLQMMFTDRPLELFVDPKYRDVRLGILEKVDINSPVRWLSRMIVTLKKDGSLIIKKINDAIPRQTNIKQSPFFLCVRLSA